MYLIVGLGNPGREYEKTRHNVGFVAIDYLASQIGANISKIKLLRVEGWENWVLEIKNERINIFL